MHSYWTSLVIAIENAFLYENQKRKAKEHAEEILKHEREIEKKNKVLAEQKDEIEQTEKIITKTNRVGITVLGGNLLENRADILWWDKFLRV